MPPQHTNSLPQTPPSEAANDKSAKRGAHSQPSVRETFLDDFNPADNANDSNNSGDERDPHDLSLSPKHAARTSIVDNMLLSLDQFASGSVLDDYRLFNSVFETDLYGRTSQDSFAQRRYRGHTFSSSMSSDVEGNFEDSTGGFASPPARGRRSNSSLNYHSSLKQFGGPRSREGTGSRGQIFDYLAGSSAAAGAHATRNGSKGSSSSHADFGPPLQRRRAESTDERRSSSFDYGTRQTFVPFSDPIVDYGSFTFDDFDTAPTPSIPSGPSKFHLSSQGEFAGSLNPQHSRTPVASRRNSIKSPRTNNTRKTGPENISTATARSPEPNITNIGNSGLEPPPVIPAASLDPPAPSPTISFNKTAFPPPPDPVPAKERPGFFQRVFGSAKVPNFGPSNFNHSDYSFTQENDPKESSGLGPSTKSWRQPLKNSPAGFNAAREGSHQVVTKKSSFFRRRKKSVAESAPPPIVLPQELAGQKAIDSIRSEPSPASSLKKAMNPYTVDPSAPRSNQPNKPLDLRAAPDDAGTKAQAALMQNQRASLLTPSGQSKAKYSLYPAILLGSANDTSFLGNSSGDEEPIIGSGGQDPIPSVDTQQKQPASRDGATSRGSDMDSVDGDQFAALQGKLSLLRPLETAVSSLSPVVENFSNTSAAPTDGSEDALRSNSKELEAAKNTHASDSHKDGLDGLGQFPTPAAGINISPRPSTSEISNYYTASETAAVSSATDPKPPGLIGSKVDDAAADEPTTSEREQAQMLFDSQDQVVGSEPAAAWLGDPDRSMIRKAYMDFFDWSNLNILAALRSLCTRLILKGETQQVDRVLDAFSQRWCQCNPRHSFKASDVVHTICYSLLLLNTDLHLADIDQKMTKSQFVRNTMPTIHRVAADATSLENSRSTNKSKPPTPDPASSNWSQSAAPDERTDKAPTKLVNRLSRTDLSVKMAGDPESDSGPLISTPFSGTMRAWEQQVETVLRDFYTSIQKQKLPLYGAQVEKEGPRASSNNLLGPHPSGLRRSPSTVSKSGSDIYPRGRSADSRYGTARWSSKPRSRARLYPPSTMGSSRTSLDDQASLWSPSASSTWSKYSSGKLTSASVDSFGSDYPRGDYQQSIGFANALSQAIIREDSAHSIASSEDVDRTTPLLEDETLQLAGAPWAKEGSLKHKHHLDSVDKRAKDRNWNECFAVIQQGWMRLFSFNASMKTLRQKAKQRHPGGVVVGGGNWTENAEEIWKFLLRQTIASALPPPGYSKSRPHVWALSLPTGAVHLFQAGTPEIVREFVSSANYWSARLSKEPLIGGISNMEYGWSDAVINSALISAESSRTPPSSSGARPSIQSSIRSSIDQQGVRPRLPADRVHISDWAPPQQSMMASALPEAEQLKALQTYVKNVEDELQRHNELRPAMILAFSPRHPNAAKALANWERKSSYLLREIVKFRTYIDSLSAALDQKNRIYANREESSPPQ